MTNIYITDMSHEYYVDIANLLVESGTKVKVVGASRSADYWPDTLDSFIASEGARVVLWEDFNFPERFARIFDPDYSFLTPQMLLALSHYEKMFLMSTDRLSFFPISQIERCRLFYRFTAHFYKILRAEQIDGIVFFGIPHGLAAISLFGLAKALGLRVMYVDWAGLAPCLSTIETELKPRRSYSADEKDVGLIANGEAFDEIQNLVRRSIMTDCVWNPPKPKNRLKTLLRGVGSLILKSPLADYISPEFFLCPTPRTRVRYVLPLLKYHREMNAAVRYYDEHCTDDLPDQKSIVLFLHFQPEAITMPQGGIFADQLLVLDLILGAIPPDMKVYVKEHPFMFDLFAQDRHERSVDFYRYMLRDPRVRLVDRSVSSKVLLDRARIVASTNGTISWEAMRLGKPCIIFGWSWFAACRSCFQVDSVESLRTALDSAATKTSSDVDADLQAFIAEFERRLILAAPFRFALNYAQPGFQYRTSVERLARGIAATLAPPGARWAGQSLIGTTEKSKIE